MSAGALNRYGTLQSRTAGTDAAGQPLQTWSDVGGVWANVRGETGMGSIRRPQETVTTDVARYSVRIRHRTDINAGWRWVCDGQVFDIKAVRQDLAGREWTDLICEIGGNDG